MFVLYKNTIKVRRLAQQDRFSGRKTCVAAGKARCTGVHTAFPSAWC